MMERFIWSSGLVLQPHPAAVAAVHCQSKSALYGRSSTIPAAQSVQSSNELVDIIYPVRRASGIVAHPVMFTYRRPEDHAPVTAQ